jgi:methyl-accepting chemotaxis protein
LDSNQGPRDYEARHAFWSDRANWESDDGVNEEAYALVAKDSDAEERNFWSAVDDRLIPALRSGDAIGVETAMAQIAVAYAKHRAIADEIVKAAIADQAKRENIARDEIAFFSIVVYAVIAATLLLAALGFFVLLRRVIRPVAGVTDVMTRQASGDLNAEAAGAERGDEIGDMVRALEVFRGNLVETERMRIQQAEDSAKAEEHRRASLREMARGVEAEASSAVMRVSSEAAEMARLAVAMTGSVSNVTE